MTSRDHAALVQAAKTVKRQAVGGPPDPKVLAALGLKMRLARLRDHMRQANAVPPTKNRRPRP